MDSGVNAEPGPKVYGFRVQLQYYWVTIELESAVMGAGTAPHSVLEE